MAKHILVLMEDEYEGMMLIRGLEAAQFYAKSTYEDSPDIIVLDSNYRGPAVLRTLQDIERKFRSTSIPVILMGPSPSGDIARALKKYGTSKTLRKPCEPKDVVEAIKTIMQRLGKEDD
jgi:DNA-binding response OmpR family regulator